MSILAKNKENTPKNAKKQIKEYQILKCQLKGAQFLHLACQGGRLAPLSPRQLRHSLQRQDEVTCERCSVTMSDPRVMSLHQCRINNSSKCNNCYGPRGLQ